VVCICYGDLFYVFAEKGYLGFRERLRGRVSMQILAIRIEDNVFLKVLVEGGCCNFELGGLKIGL